MTLHYFPFILFIQFPKIKSFHNVLHTNMNHSLHIRYVYMNTNAKYYFIVTSF